MSQTLETKINILKDALAQSPQRSYNIVAASEAFLNACDPDPRKPSSLEYWTALIEANVIPNMISLLPTMVKHDPKVSSLVEYLGNTLS